MPLCNCTTPEDWGGRCRVCGLRTDDGFNAYVMGLCRSTGAEMGDLGWRRKLHEGPVTQWYWWHPQSGWVRDGPCACSEMAATMMYPVKMGDFDVPDEVTRRIWASFRKAAYVS